MTHSFSRGQERHFFGKCLLYSSGSCGTDIWEPGCPLLSALLLAGFLPLTLRLWFIETITGRWLGTVLGVLIQLALELSE